MQSIPAKKSGFKCPTFAVPSRKTDAPKDSTETPLDAEKTVLPSPAGDNLSVKKKQTTATCNASESNKDGDIREKVTKPVKEKLQKPKTTKVGATEKDNAVKKKIKKKKKEKEKCPEDSKYSEKECASEKPLTDKSTEEKTKDEADTTQSDESPVERTKAEENVTSNDKRKQHQALPVRSLSEEEYDEIFTAAVENAMKLDLDQWEPKVTSPIKVREPLVKKYGKVVGKKPKPSVEDPVPDKPAEQKEETNTNEHKEESVSEETHETNQESVNVLEDKNFEVDQEIEEEAETNQQEDAGIAEQQNDGPPDVQRENETTPPASEVDFSAAPGQASPPPKKKKIYVKKKERLEPKQLPFEATPMIDKIKKLKKLKKEFRIEKEITSKKEMEKTSRNIKKVKKIKSGGDDKPKQKLGKSRRKSMLDRNIDYDGTWVQCCSCKKWRHLKDVADPTQIPEVWTCGMNTCEDHNSCDKQEEEYDESDHIYTKFTEGSVVWAKMSGYPWWPAMVEQDPDSEAFFSIDSENSMQPTDFHVVFFDERVSRIWVKAMNLKTFTGNESYDGVLVPKMTKKGLQSYKKEISVATKNANRALSCDLKTRIELYGFAARYKGSWGKMVSSETENINIFNKDRKKKKKKKRARTQSEGPVALLDESTISSVIENTESLLDNVEEMLDNIDDQLDDSDLDSDFEPDGLVVVEKRKQKKRGQNEGETKKRKKLEPEAGDIYSDKTASDCDPEAENENQRITFDSDIFTAEMDESSMSESDKPTESKAMGSLSKSSAVDESKGRKNMKTSKDFANCKITNISSKVCQQVSSDEPTEEASHLELVNISTESTKLNSNPNNNNEYCDNHDKYGDDMCDEDDLVPGSDVNVTSKSSQQSFNFGEESDDDFGLQEKSMYDGLVDGAHKSQERATIPVPVMTNSQEDSDPFDMIEE